MLCTGNSGEPSDNKFGIVTMLSDLKTTNLNSHTIARRPSDTTGFNISESKSRQFSYGVYIDSRKGTWIAKKKTSGPIPMLVLREFWGALKKPRTAAAQLTSIDTIKIAKVSRKTCGDEKRGYWMKPIFQILNWLGKIQKKKVAWTWGRRIARRN